MIQSRARKGSILLKNLFRMQLLLLLAVKAFAGGGSEKPTDSRQITIGVLKGPSGFGIIRLIEETKELPRNTAVHYLILPSPEEMVARLGSGELQAGLLPLNMAAKLYTRGGGFPMAALTGRGALYILSREPTLKDWMDLPGHTVYAIGKGATPDYLFRYYLANKGIDPAALTVDFSIPAVQLAQMATAGKVDTILISQPFAALIQLKAPDMQPRLDFQQAWMDVQAADKPYPITAFVVSPALAHERPEAYAQLLKAYRDSIAWVLAKPAQAAVLIEKHGILAAPAAQAAIPYCGLDFIPAPAAKTETEAYLKVLLEFDPVSIGGTLPDENFYLAP
ncbi:MAG: hypothetical protein B0D92_03885 [Spirochaeta sp. LUC14_002_19_P3]|nr:MAG: hypothetical protein B0D92_03885 [Spirochaeta sp. LUC14_002_19_P3]